ncbi:Hypothetical predicted protein, partial [Paramuricea clavata]
MASRGLLCQPAKPKRILIFFSVDQTTAVLETTKVKHAIKGDVVQEGATVLVEFGKENFEASVIKLHDDPSVLVEAETDFLIQMFGNENQEVTVDKENMPPTTLTTGKETQGNNTKATSVSSKPKARPKEVRKRMKSKELSDQSKAKRPKT